ncbi:MAG: alpha/beta hydrolase [Planctomycetota bacterium]|nr:alpha/beta hydrolase [Planctomycetota bacterium]
MRSHPKGHVAGSLLVGLLALGCSAPPGPVPAGTSRLDVGVEAVEVEIWGHGEPWIVCVAGVGGSLHSFDPIREGLGARGTALRYSRAGHDSSTYSHGPKDFEAILEELEGVVDAAGVPDGFVLVGHSFGGLITRAFATRHPEKVAGLLSIDPTFEDYLEVLEPLVLGARQLERASFEGSDEQAFVDEYEALFGVWDSPERWSEWFSYPASVPHIVLTSTRIGRHPMRGSAEVMQARLEAQARTIARSSLAIQIPTAESGHGVHHQEPGLTLEALDRLLESLDPAPTR